MDRMNRPCMPFATKSLIADAPQENCCWPKKSRLRRTVGSAAASSSGMGGQVASALAAESSELEVPKSTA